MLAKLKTRGIFKRFLTAIAFILVLPATALANHQHTQLGDNPVYGHFGQPHGYIISGDFTFIVQTHGSVDRVLFKIVKPNDINNVLGNYAQTSITNGINGDKYFNLVWNSTGFADGSYYLFADVESDSATPNGYRDTVFHYDGTNHLGFSVKNPIVTPPPISQPPEDTCSSKLDNAKRIASRIYEKRNSTLIYIDNFLQQTTLFYKKNATNVKNHDGDLIKIGEIRKAASDSTVTLDKLSDFTCGQSLRVQVDNYLDKSSNARNQLDDYKDSVINLMVIVLGELNG
jgi:hypothetical protein